jgi:hypothetical protein
MLEKVLFLIGLTQANLKLGAKEQQEAPEPVGDVSQRALQLHSLAQAQSCRSAAIL